MIGDLKAKEGVDCLQGFLILDSLLVVRHGKIVTEAYYAPYAAGVLHQVNSVTKALTSTLTAIALKDGMLDSPSHRVLDFFERREIANGKET